jgi:hypothetical protein
MTCESCLQEHYLPAGNLCLPCSQKLKHRKDVEEFKKNAAMKEKEVLITDF